MLPHPESTLAPLMQLRPIVIVGAGPVGMRMATELHRRLPDVAVLIYGAERWSPYNRVRLSSALAGETTWVELMLESKLPQTAKLSTRLGCSVIAIDRVGRCVIDDQGNVQPYRFLVLATGSKPHIPNIPGIGLPGVYTFRDMDNALQLAARRARTHRTVVLGGGLLGIEAARAMQRSHTEVYVVEHYDRLMPRQLDARASQALQQNIEALGIHVVLDDGPLAIYGDTRVEGVELRTGRKIACDTVIISAGIRPNIDIAQRAKLAIGRGIRVDDSMRTSDAYVFAVGECAEHRGQIYGLVAPGLEQAAVAAHIIAGDEVQYAGSSAATRLKVLNYPVFSMGEVAADELPDLAQEYRYSVPSENIYRKLVLRRGRLIGALAMGEWGAIPRIQEAVLKSRRVWPWQRWYFRRYGSLWLQPSALQVQDWPVQTVVCNCTGITRGQLSAAINSGCNSFEALSSCTGAASVCGSCKPLLQTLLGNEVPRVAPPAVKPLLGLALFAALLAAAFLILPGLPFADTVAAPWRWDTLWRDNLAKQMSGYSLLALAVALAVLGLRKRVQRFIWGEYNTWRFVHTTLGVGVLLGFLVHTGGHLGTQLNFYLALSFVGATLAGGALASVVACEHMLDPVRGRRWKNAALWGHILFLWPLPILLGFHIAQGYLF